ncbi:MAG: sugar nucleotide-binding protein, partial [Halieaceae bacterium]
VINCAAKTNTKFCEKNRLEAFADNVDLADRIASLCQKKGYKNIYVSSEVVFGANEANHLPVETCRPHPVTWYGATKRMGELVTLNKGGMVIRLPILINLSDDSTVLGEIYKKLKSGLEIRASASCFSTPITYREAAIGISQIIFNRRYDHEPIIHLTGNSYMSIYDLFLQIAIREGLSESLIGVFQHGAEDRGLILKSGGLKSEIFPPIKSSIKGQ